MDIEQARFNMIEQQIRPSGVLDPQVLDVLAGSRRELFVPTALQTLAFADIEIPLGQGQSMLRPVLEALVLQAIKPRRSDRVLEIGTGSGFMAALLGACADAVLTLEIEPTLAAYARAALARAGADNVCVETADGNGGWPSGAPYDLIVASGAVSVIPKRWVQQIAVGGRIFAFVGQGSALQAQVLTRVGEEEVRSETVFETQVPRLHLPEAEAFHL